LSGALADGKSALGDLDSKGAKAAFERALLIDLAHVDALAGLRRSGVIDQVTEELIEVDRLTTAGELVQAKVLAEKLQGVDPLDPRLPGRISKLSSTIRELNYVAAMSRGYAAIQNSDYPTAIAAFRQALTIKPGAADALQAIADAGNQSVQAQVTILIEDARSAEATENWYSALESYKAILAIEEKSVLGVTGKVRVGARWNLDQQLESFLEDPDSVLDPEVMARASQLHTDALAMTTRGPRLDRQTGELGKMLEAIGVPVVVNLLSDGETDVTLLKHGGLGKFKTHQLTIKPGKYVALGQRNGYRDVRVDFLVRVDGAAQPVMVQCEEPIFKRS
jgi:tetratricopeptide (TPR) repeat protein